MSNSTPINQLPNESENNETIPEMQNDDSNSQMVSEIIQEMNNSAPQQNNAQMPNNSMDNMPINNEQQMYMDEQSGQFNRQMDPNVNMMMNDDLEPEQEYDQPIMQPVPMEQPMQVVQQTKSSLKDKVIQQLKEPLVVTATTFAVSLPMVQNLLAKYLPKLFGIGVTNTIKTMGLLIKAIIAGVIFFALKTIL